MLKTFSLSDFIQSTFKISTSYGDGSALMCRYDREYVLMFTCWHLFCQDYKHVGVPFSENQKWNEVHFKICNSDCDVDTYGQCMRPTDDSDMCAVVFKNGVLPVCLDYCDALCTDLFSVGDEIFMPGFPFITSDKNYLFSGKSVDASYMEALLRHGYIMGTVRDKNRDVILFDMRCNVGFSGSPVILKRIDPVSGMFSYQILSVMSGHYKDMSQGNYEVVKNECERAGIHFANMVSDSGISYGCKFSKIVPYIPELIRRKEYTK